MFNYYRNIQFKKYREARSYFIDDYSILIELERFFSDQVFELLNLWLKQITEDYDEASFLYPFWQNYPPDDRGRKPRGDQYPWIEVGEHALGCKLLRMLDTHFQIRDVGLPTGPDQRVIVKHKDISKITKGYTDSAWLFIDIKSVGPRDDQEHTVMSHNQISGSGKWNKIKKGIINDKMTAIGKRTKHSFHCSIPPIYILSNETAVPVVHLVVKPVYRMLKLENSKVDGGQPLDRITLITIPNGLLLEEKPSYLSKHPGLLFPGKDDKTKNPLKVRCRICFKTLKTLAEWRVREVNISKSTK